MGKKNKIVAFKTQDLEFVQANLDKLYEAYIIAYNNEIATKVVQPAFNRALLDNHFALTVAETLAVRGATNRWRLYTKQEFAEKILDMLTGQ